MNNFQLRLPVLTPITIILSCKQKRSDNNKFMNVWVPKKVYVSIFGLLQFLITFQVVMLRRYCNYFDLQLCTARFIEASSMKIRIMKGLFYHFILIKGNRDFKKVGLQKLKVAVYEFILVINMHQLKMLLIQKLQNLHISYQEHQSNLWSCCKLNSNHITMLLIIFNKALLSTAPI